MKSPAKFWVCIAMSLINLGMASIAKQLNRPDLQEFSLFVMSVCALCAAGHWYLDRLEDKKKQ